MTQIRPLVVSVIGSAHCDAHEASIAEDVGRLLAGNGAILVCGGMGGVMEAACRGAHGEGGITIGILPGAQASEGNSYLSLALPTGMGHARNSLVVQAGQAVIAIGGGYGTLSEIGLAFKVGRKVIGLGTWRATSGRGNLAPILEATTSQEAVKMALAAADRERH